MKRTLTNFKYLRARMKFLLHLIILTMTLLSISCSGDDGRDGIDGETGPQGPAGQDGNANVISTDWVEFQSAVWEDLVDEFEVPTRNYPVSVPEITQEILDSGTILVYTKFSGILGEVFQLPILAQNQVLRYSTGISRITIKYSNLNSIGDPGTFGAPDSGNTFYRFIIIPSTTSTTASLDLERVDTNNFYAVATHFGLAY